MSVPVIQLRTGQVVKLGKLKERVPFHLTDKLWMHDYLKLAGATPVPSTVDYSVKSAAAIAQMYLNDTYGDCVIASTGHSTGVWSGNETGTPIIATDAEIKKAYTTICGPGDKGCVIQDVLDYWKENGITLGGQLQKISDYIALDNTQQNLVEIALYLFGSIKLGIDLPQAWTNDNVWDVTNTQIVGGHDVCVIGYNPTGPVIATWGSTRQMTWAAFTSTNWVTESWIPLSPLWTENGNLAPCGLDVTTLETDLALLGKGQAPTIDPTPPSPVTPPVPGPIPVTPPVPTPSNNLISFIVTLNGIILQGMLTGQTEDQIIASLQNFLTASQSKESLFNAVGSMMGKMGALSGTNPCTTWNNIQPDFAAILNVVNTLGKFIPWVGELGVVLTGLGNLMNVLCPVVHGH